MHLVNAALGSRAFLTGMTELQPGSKIPAHFHNCEETVTILEGVGVFERDGEQSELRPFDTTWVTAGVRHRFRNDGSSTLTILWVYASPTATRTLVSSGAESAIGGGADVFGGHADHHEPRTY
jgi:quercetin dioxygenase-like cupin family protein